MTKKSYGSGNFGNWFNDEFGLPAYEYTCNQYLIPEKMPLVNKDSIWGDYRNHWNQIGNDRIIGMPSNFGYIRIRQDEGAPKILNDYVPKNRQYSGGFGYLSDGTGCLSTFYCQQENFRRVFGTGYFLKETGNEKYDVSETTFAPFGDDPVLLTKVTVKNKTDQARDLKWFMYWGHDVYQHSSRPMQYASFNDVRIDYNYYFRKEFAKNFRRTYTGTDNGARVDFTFTGYHYPEKDEARKIASVAEVNEKISPVVGDDCFYEDVNQPAMYCVLLNEDLKASCRYSGQSFFANNDLLHPTGIDSDDDSGEKDALIVSAEFTLAAGESRDLYFLFGYEPESIAMNGMIVKYRYCAESELARTMKCWHQNLITMEVEGDASDQSLLREMTWHNYFLRTSMTYDTSIHSHMLNQACHYEYIIGNNVFVRDIAEHCAPYIYSDPAVAKELIDFQLKMVDVDGYIFSGLTGKGVLMQDARSRNDIPAFYIAANAGGSDIGEVRTDNRPPMEQRYDDQELWPLWIVSEYVLANKDFDYLNEYKYGYTSLNNEKPRTVLEICKLLFDYTKNSVGTGKHGLVRLMWNDWSRALFHAKARPVPPEDAKTASKIGESLFTSGLATACTQMFAELLREIGDPKAEEVQEYCDGLKEAINNVFNGKWIPRIWVNDNYGFVGDTEEFFMEGNCWPLVSKALNDENAAALIRNMKELVMDPSPIGCMKQRKSPDYDGPENDGWIWWAMNGPMIWGLTQYDHELAYEQFKKMSLARHAEVYPDIWIGIWSADDQYTSILNQYPGYTRFRKGILENLQHYMDGHPDDFEVGDAIKWPIQCLHPHAWPLYVTMQFLQPHFTKDGVTITPSIPAKTYSVDSPLLGYRQNPEGICGHYRPKVSGEYRISIDLKHVSGPCAHLKVNGSETAFEKDGTIITFTGKAEDVLEWELN